MDEQNNASNIAGKVLNGGVMAFGIFSLVKSFFGAVVIIAILVISMRHGLPLYIGLLFIFFVIMGFVLQIVRLKRILSVNLATDSPVNITNTENTEKYDENNSTEAN